MNIAKAQNYLPEVRDQYEDYPYPARRPEDEKIRLLAPSLDCLDALNHYCFSGKRDYSKHFRALVAGGGTGDSVIFLAEQLRHMQADIVYIDISTASMEVAKARSAARGLENIRFLHCSILDLPKADLGTFDYINCSGVLHHLKNPDDGLAALEGVLNAGGAMGIMLYATHGRQGIYPLQALLRMLNDDTNDSTEKIDRTKRLLAELGPQHLFSHYRSLFKDIDQFGDVGIYDLLLHSQDRAYTVADIYDYLGRAGLIPVKLSNTSDALGNRVYDPSAFLKHEIFAEPIAVLTEQQRQSLGELLHGSIIKHNFYAMRERPPLPQPTLDMVPTYTMCSSARTYTKLYEMCRGNSPEVVFKSSADTVRFPRTGNTELIFKYLDGKRSLKEIFKRVMSDKGKGNFISLLDEFKVMYAAMNHPHNTSDWVMLHHASLPAYPTLEDLQQNIKGLTTT